MGGQTAKARTAAGPGRRRQHRPGATAAHTHRHSPYHAATSAGARGTPSSTLPQARTVSVAAGPSTPPISDALIPPPPPPPSPLPAPADSGAAADTRRRRWQQWEPVPLQRWARSRRHQQREPAAAASGGGEIKTQWLTLLLSRTCKRGSNQAGARADAPGSVRGSRHGRPGGPARAVGRAAATTAAAAAPDLAWPPGDDAPGPVRGTRRRRQPGGPATAAAVAPSS